MAGYETPYSVLGLRPGAGRDEINDAYRRLIKRHHPDYTGGDGDRAAEINRAYSELRKQFPRPLPQRPAVMPMPARQPPARHPPPPRRRDVAQRLFALVAIVGGLVLARSATTESQRPWPAFPVGTAPAAVGEAQPVAIWTAHAFDEPLASDLIDQAVGDAVRLHQEDDVNSAASFSRSCLDELHKKPSLPRFDACAAFDESIAILESGDPAHESGPFNPSAVTARQVGAARLLTSDYLESESRLQQIRSRVHMALLPEIPDSIAAAEAILVGSPAR